MKLTRIKLEKFTAFEKLDLELSEGINVFIGANATGKTHLMKLAYASCDITKTQLDFAEKLTNAIAEAFADLYDREVKRNLGAEK